MSFFSRIKEAFAPRRLEQSAPIVNAKPLHEQFQRIGGGLTPATVSWILQAADGGQPAQLIDLAHESRAKDGHMQSVLYTREQAVALCDVDFIEPESPKARDQRATKLCRQIVDNFENWPDLVEHLTSAFFYGHATAEIRWERRKGLLLPVRAVAIPQRDFIFSIDQGALRYARHPGDVTGVDLLAENPGRIIQIQRRIVGDVPAREGLLRMFVWAALFRNWTLRDWIALAEIGWKPWRVGKYKKGAGKEDIEALRNALERIGSTGVGTISELCELLVEWPKGMAPGTGGSGTHRELIEWLGREMSKAALGQTTSVEAGPNGDRAATETRDKVRSDIRERDARAGAAALRRHLFAPAVAVNIGAEAVVPVPWFQTDEAVDQLAFAQAVKALAESGCRIPAKWVRGEFGSPEPSQQDEVVGVTEDEPEDDGNDPEDENDEDADKAA